MILYWINVKTHMLVWECCGNDHAYIVILCTDTSIHTRICSQKTRVSIKYHTIQVVVRDEKLFREFVELWKENLPDISDKPIISPETLRFWQRGKTKRRGRKPHRYYGCSVKCSVHGDCPTYMLDIPHICSISHIYRHIM